MVNYRVSKLHTLLTALYEVGCEVLDKVEESEYGKFGWIMDPEGNKIELWEPPYLNTMPNKNIMVGILLAETALLKSPYVKH
jgi:hypothetical protein